MQYNVFYVAREGLGNPPMTSGCPSESMKGHCLSATDEKVLCIVCCSRSPPSAAFQLWQPYAGLGHLRKGCMCSWDLARLTSLPYPTLRQRVDCQTMAWHSLVSWGGKIASFGNGSPEPPFLNSAFSSARVPSLSEIHFRVTSKSKYLLWVKIRLFTVLESLIYFSHLPWNKYTCASGESTRAVWNGTRRIKEDHPASLKGQLYKWPLPSMTLNNSTSFTV